MPFKMHHQPFDRAALLRFHRTRPRTMEDWRSCSRFDPSPIQLLRMFAEQSKAPSRRRLVSFLPASWQFRKGHWPRRRVARSNVGATGCCFIQVNKRSCLRSMISTAIMQFIPAQGTWHQQQVTIMMMKTSKNSSQVPSARPPRQTRPGTIWAFRPWQKWRCANGSLVDTALRCRRTFWRSSPPRWNWKPIWKRPKEDRFRRSCRIWICWMLETRRRRPRAAPTCQSLTWRCTAWAFCASSSSSACPSFRLSKWAGGLCESTMHGCCSKCKACTISG
mmetsp:Transcript_10192/g.29054  ORF Transcript_10192/g.29054 Transcript_10192/m.29054 type:complete len:277 (-) Transcript_10192:2072-2902(-)